jgi:competence protein ComGC
MQSQEDGKRFQLIELLIAIAVCLVMLVFFIPSIISHRHQSDFKRFFNQSVLPASPDDCSYELRRGVDTRLSELREKAEKAGKDGHEATEDLERAELAAEEVCGMY